MGSPLFWIGVGVGLSVIFQVVANRLKVSFGNNKMIFLSLESVFYLLLLCHLCGHWEQYSMVVNIGINIRHSKNLAFVDVSPEELFHNERSFMNEVSKASPMVTQSAKEIQTNGTVKQNASSSTEQPNYRQLFNLFKAHKDPR
ncbi:uncharacterized protein LOC122051943 [Zingiber officinale]|uniref:uncharacterized protein LOC122051943 n=1 Tax=Zingiber officinale TaxID=94328 RepID=UPI001C4D5782|nr:uncharacterized protein LOC122051943 [Zingiber officinale]